MKRSLTLAASAFGLGAAALCAAQTPIDATPSGISFRLGAVLALDSGLRDVDKTWVAIGMDYTFPKQFLRNSETYIGVDYIFRSSSGDRGSFWPLMLGQRFYTDDGDVDAGSRSYLNVGIGVVFFDITGSEVGGGLKAGFGKEFGPNIFGEATLFLSESRQGVNANSLGFFIGYRF
jgi:hypothetical protein